MRLVLAERHLETSLHSLASRCEGKFVTLCVILVVLIMYNARRIAKQPSQECMRKFANKMIEKINGLMHFAHYYSHSIYSTMKFFN